MIDYRTGTGITEPDPEEVLSDYARAALEGTCSFPEFATERGDETSTPTRLYADWIAAVHAHDMLTSWCASPEMLADLYAVHTG